MHKKQIRFRFLILIPIIILWLSNNLFYFWIKLAGWILTMTGLLELICFLMVTISTIVLIIKLISKSDWRNFSNYLTVGIALVVLVILKIPKLNFNENTFQSPVIIRACYEGTMNTSRLYLRENGTFENYNIGFFALVSYSHGIWEKRDDSLFLNYEENKKNLKEVTIVIKEDYLYRLQADTLVPMYYYLGYCKGLN